MTKLELLSVTSLFCDVLTETANSLKLNQGDSLAQMHIIAQLNDAVESFTKSITPDAINQAMPILAADNRTNGEFCHELLTSSNHTKLATYQIQITEVFDLDDYHRYQSEEAVAWRAAKAKRNDYRAQASSQTGIMAAQLKAYIEKHKDKAPDDIKVTLKCIRDKRMD